MKNIKNFPTLVVFISLIFGLTILDIVTPDVEFSDLENKYMDQKPSFSFSDFVDNTFVPKYESYVDEQFFMRNNWINLKSRSEFYLGKLENNSIVYGDDDYMFNKCLSIDQSKSDQNLKMLENFVELYPEENVDVLLIPNSYEILKNKLPYDIKLFDQNAFIDDYYKQLSEYKNVNTVDAYSALDEHKDEYIYYKTDHHWTTLGAHYVYSEYMDELGSNHTNYDELVKDSVSYFYGTYYSKSKKFNCTMDVIEYILDLDVSCTIGGEKVDSIYDLSKFETRDKYAAFLHGNNDLTIVKRNKKIDEKYAYENDGTFSGNKKSILIVKDSFGNSFVPLLTENYDEIYVVDLRANTMNLSEIIENNNFDRILFLYSVDDFVKDKNFIKLIY